MGVAIKSLGDTATLMRKNPSLWLLGGALWVVFQIIGFILNLIPIIGGILAFFITAIWLVGVLSMAYAGRNGNAGFSSFMDGVSEHYLSYVGAATLLGTVAFVLTFGIAIVMVFVAPVGAAIGNSPEAALLSSGVFLALFAGFGLLFVIGFMCLQFFDVAIVVGDEGATGGIMKSFELVTSEPISVIGYSLLRFIVGGGLFFVPVLLFFVVGGGLSVLAEGAGAGAGVGAGLSIGLLAGGAVYFIVIMPLAQIFLLTYHVAFFNRHQARGAI